MLLVQRFPESFVNTYLSIALTVLESQKRAFLFKLAQGHRIQHLVFKKLFTTCGYSYWESRDIHFHFCLAGIFVRRVQHKILKFYKHSQICMACAVFNSLSSSISLSFSILHVVQDIYLVGESEVEQYWQLEGVGGKEVVEGG